MSEDKSTLSQAFRNRAFLALGWIIFCAVLFWGFNYWPPFMSTIFLPVLMGVLIAEDIFEGWKHRTPSQLMADNKHFSLNPDDIFRVGRWVLFRVGGVATSGFNFKGREGTVIVPEELVHDNGHGIITRVNLTETDFKELMPEIRRKINTHRLPPPYYFSFVPTYDMPNTAEIEKRQKSLMDLETKFNEQNTRITDLEAMLTGKHKDFRKLFRHYKDVVGDSRLEKIRKKIWKGERTEEEQ